MKDKDWGANCTSPILRSGKKTTHKRCALLRPTKRLMLIWADAHLLNYNRFFFKLLRGFKDTLYERPLCKWHQWKKEALVNNERVKFWAANDRAVVNKALIVGLSSVLKRRNKIPDALAHRCQLENAFFSRVLQDGNFPISTILGFMWMVSNWNLCNCACFQVHFKCTVMQTMWLMSSLW